MKDHQNAIDAINHQHVLRIKCHDCSILNFLIGG